MTRPYIQSAQGRISYNFVDKENANFIGVVFVDTSINAPTVVYAMHKGKTDPWYPYGFHVKVTDS